MLFFIDKCYLFKIHGVCVCVCYDEILVMNLCCQGPILDVNNTRDTIHTMSQKFHYKFIFPIHLMLF